MYQEASGMGWIWMIITGVIMVIPFWRICTRAGFHGALSLLVLVPLINFAFFYFLAFAKWPAHKTAPADSVSEP